MRILLMHEFYTVNLEFKHLQKEEMRLKEPSGLTPMGRSLN